MRLVALNKRGLWVLAKELVQCYASCVSQCFEEGLALFFLILRLRNWGRFWFYRGSVSEFVGIFGETGGRKAL